MFAARLHLACCPMLLRVFMGRLLAFKVTAGFNVCRTVAILNRISATQLASAAQTWRYRPTRHGENSGQVFNAAVAQAGVLSV